MEEDIAESLKTHGYTITSGSNLDAKGVDMLAQKGRHLFAIDVKSRPIETFDIVSSSTISTRLKSAHTRVEVYSVLTTDYSIPEKAKTLGKKVGVIVTEPPNLVEEMNSVSRITRRKKKLAQE